MSALLWLLVEVVALSQLLWWFLELDAVLLKEYYAQVVVVVGSEKNNSKTCEFKIQPFLIAIIMQKQNETTNLAECAGNSRNVIQSYILHVFLSVLGLSYPPL